MTPQSFLNKKYLALCQQLGDSQLKLEQLQAHIDHLKSQIKTLNDSFSIIAEFEQANKETNE